MIMLYAMKTLELTRPLIAFDLETTGLSTKSDRIIELSCIKLYPDRSREEFYRLLNPTCKIAKAATEIHGINDEKVMGCPTFAQIAVDLLSFMADCDFTGFNLKKFDLPMLIAEFERVETTFPKEGTRIIDTHEIFITREPRNLEKAYEKYCNKALIDAHSASADANAALEVLLAQISYYEDLPTTVEELGNAFSPSSKNWIDGKKKLYFNKSNEACLSFGKYRGRSLKWLKENEPGYLRWMLNMDFAEDVREIAQAALKGRFPVKH